MQSATPEFINWLIDNKLVFRPLELDNFLLEYLKGENQEKIIQLIQKIIANQVKINNYDLFLIYNYADLINPCISNFF